MMEVSRYSGGDSTVEEQQDTRSFIDYFRVSPVSEWIQQDDDEDDG